MTLAELDAVAKGVSIGTFTCDYSTEEAFDKFMDGELEVTSWEPFEYYTEAQLAVQIDSLKSTIYGALRMYCTDVDERNHANC